MRTRTLLVISAIIALLVGGSIYFLVSNADAEAAGSSNSKVSVDEAKVAPAPTLVGEWHQTNSENGILAEASISDVGTIQINLKTRDSSSIYWMGSFDTNKDPRKPFETVSQGDPDAMAMSIFGSQDKTKTFSYENGELSYKFTMMGTTTTVRLTKK